MIAPPSSRQLDAPLSRWVQLFCALVAIAGCDRRSAAPAAPTPSAEASAIVTDAGESCGALGCVQLATAQDALRIVLAEDPRVLAIGEAHAPGGATVPSAAKRFTAELLPLLAGRASDLLVELMLPPPGCADAAAEVRQRQAPATSQQAPTNQNEYVAMGERARALGIVPDMLRPSCADMDRVRAAGDDAIDASLELIALLSTLQLAARLVDRDARSPTERDKIVVVYGGMLHNDLAPSPEHAKWTYAPALDAKTGGKLVALDLVVPEFIVDDPTWRDLPWVPHYDRARMGAKATLFRVAPRSFVLVLPESAP